MVFDTWAWWEILHDTELGGSLAQRYLEAPGVRVLTLDLAIAELAAKLARTGQEALIEDCAAAIEASSEVLSIGKEVAMAAGRLLVELRRTDRQASLADALMLAAARARGAKLVSANPCFAGQVDVVAE